MTSDLLIWQLADSAFPTGGFAHSWGLEAAWQHGEVTNGDSLRRFVRDSATQAGYGALPFVRAAHEDPARLVDLDLEADAFLRNPVANRASRVQGRALLSTAVRVWPFDALLDLERRADATAAHVAPLMGAVSRALAVPLTMTQRLVLFGTVRGVLAAAVRLGIVGSYEAQRIQSESATDVEAVLARCGQLDVMAVAQTAPLLDLFQSAHDRLYSRLFQS